jgi:hypothetical protein
MFPWILILTFNNRWKLDDQKEIKSFSKWALIYRELTQRENGVQTQDGRYNFNILDQFYEI